MYEIFGVSAYQHARSRGLTTSDGTQLQRRLMVVGWDDCRRMPCEVQSLESSEGFVAVLVH